MEFNRLTRPRMLFLRHGETQWNLEHRLQGRRNSDLTERGRSQAAQQGDLLRSLPGIEAFEAVTSPLGRARQTAEIALEALELDLREDARVQEVSAGDWEGLTFQEALGRPDATSFDTATLMSLFLEAPNGEGFTALRLRCRSFLSELQHPTIVVTHWIALSVMRGLLLGLDRADMERLDRTQGVIYDIAEGQETLHEPETTDT